MKSIFRFKVAKSVIEVKTTNKYGRGLYAARNIRKGEVVESSPVVELNSYDITHTRMNMYVFGWKGNGTSALALGLGSLFNHSKKANVTYNPVFSTKTILFVAMRDIRKGHQLFIDYGYDVKRGIEVTEKNLLIHLRNKYERKEHGFPKSDGQDSKAAGVCGEIEAAPERRIG
jgi:uncharacterized protein